MAPVIAAIVVYRCWFMNRQLQLLKVWTTGMTRLFVNLVVSSSVHASAGVCVLV
ncbi:conserved hypothetical protein [Ricinus communis]|uniref:Uncharacterized protein n=1 Tax=Ricinus communis TaxID=3988 RepID=B9TIY0_RICCO|nr:conserved hypothetical protein [Ricinus communis]